MFSVKDIRKLVVVSIIGACAVFVANLFLNFFTWTSSSWISKTNPMIQTYYDAQVSLSWMVAMVSGVVLSLTSILLMCFLYQTICRWPQKEQLGILKALGYSNGQLAKRFWAFGLSFGAGALLGYFASFFMMGHFMTSVMRRDFARNHHSPSLATLACFGDPANELLYDSRDWLC